jgi:hypothetical protein
MHIRTDRFRDGVYIPPSTDNMPRTSRRMTKTEAKLDKNRRVAWCKYFQSRRDNFKQYVFFYNRLKALATSAEGYKIPTHFQNKFKDLLAETKTSTECPVCLETIDPEQVDITNCGHCYCAPCKSRLDKCAVCRRNF